MNRVYLLNLLLILFFSCERNIKDCSEEVASATSKYEHYEIASSGRFIFEGLKINDVILDDNKLLSSLLKEPKLVIRFSELNCQDCVELMAKMILEHFSDRPEGIVILASFKSERTLKLYMQRLGISKFEYYSIPEQSLNNFIDRDNVPYAFILDKDLKIDNLMIPDYRLGTITESYFEIISKRL